MLVRRVSFVAVLLRKAVLFGLVYSTPLLRRLFPFQATKSYQHDLHGLCLYTVPCSRVLVFRRCSAVQYSSYISLNDMIHRYGLVSLWKSVHRSIITVEDHRPRVIQNTDV